MAFQNYYSSDPEDVMSQRARQRYGVNYAQLNPNQQQELESQARNNGEIQGNEFKPNQSSSGAPLAPTLASAIRPGTTPAAPELASAVSSTGAVGTPVAAETSMLGTVAPIAVPAIGAYTAYTAYDANKNASEGERGFMPGLRQGIRSAGPLNFVPVLGQAAWLAGAIGGMTASGKSKEQHQRDAIRANLQKGGAVDKDWNITLADGSKYNIGIDGSKLKDQAGVDLNDPLTQKIVGLANVLGAIDSGGNAERTADMAGYYTRAAMSNAKDYLGARNNILQMVQDRGWTMDQATQAINGLNIDQNTKGAYLAALASLAPGAAQFTNESAIAQAAGPAKQIPGQAQTQIPVVNRLNPNVKPKGNYYGGK